MFPKFFTQSNRLNVYKQMQTVCIHTLILSNRANNKAVNKMSTQYIIFLCDFFSVSALKDVRHTNFKLLWVKNTPLVTTMLWLVFLFQYWCYHNLVEELGVVVSLGKKELIRHYLKKVPMVKLSSWVGLIQRSYGLELMLHVQPGNPIVWCWTCY